MRRKTITLTLDAPDADGICQSQTPLAGGALTLNGALVTSGVATLDVARHLEITAAANEAARTFVVTGTARNGTALTETFVGPNATTKKLNKNFLTVTGIAIDAASAGAIYIGTTDEADTQPVPTDSYNGRLRYQGAVSVAAGLVYDIEYTLDNIWDKDWKEDDANWIKHATGKGDLFSDMIEGGITAIRANVNTYVTGTFTLDLIHPRV